MDLADWLKQHPYLARVAAFEGEVRAAAAEAASEGLALPADAGPWARANAAGVPALRDVEFHGRAADATAAALGKVLAHLATSPVAGPIGRDVASLRDYLAAGPGEAREAAEWVLDGAAGPDGESGLLRHLGWSAAAAVLAPAVRAFQAVRDVDERRWDRSTCPTCGALPVNAVLASRREGRERRFACGLCRTQWGHKRIGCPYCGIDDPGRLDLFEIEGEPMLRLDTCGGCKGYVKTVKEEGAPSFLADDWTTVMLDVLAAGKGFARRGASLYEIPNAAAIGPARTLSRARREAAAGC